MRTMLAAAMLTVAAMATSCSSSRSASSPPPTSRSPSKSASPAVDRPVANPPPASATAAWPVVAVDATDWILRRLEHLRAVSAARIGDKTVSERWGELAEACRAAGYEFETGLAMIEITEPSSVDLIWPARMGKAETDRYKTILPRWRTSAAQPAWTPQNLPARELCNGELAGKIRRKELSQVPDQMH